MNFKKKHAKYLNLFEYREPCKKTLQALVAMQRRDLKKRSQTLSDLATELLGDDDYRSSFCLWCGSKRFKKGRRRYCREDCTDSATAYCFPHSVSSKAFVFVELQGCNCKFCGENFEDLIDAFIPKEVERRRRRNKEGPKLFSQFTPLPLHVDFFAIGNHISSQFDLDHVVPIHKGGAGIGFDNVQVICKKCHKIKTARDRKKHRSTCHKREKC